MAAMERTVVDENTAVFVSLYAWFYLVQSWCSLRFDDHRGIVPFTLRNTPESLSGVLSRPETHSPDKGSQKGFTSVQQGGVHRCSILRDGPRSLLSVVLFRGENHATVTAVRRGVQTLQQNQDGSHGGRQSVRDGSVLGG